MAYEGEKIERSLVRFVRFVSFVVTSPALHPLAVLFVFPFPRHPPPTPHDAGFPLTFYLRGDGHRVGEEKNGEQRV